MKINIAGLDKAAVLAALYNASKPLGFGMLNFVPGDMSIAEANQIINGGDDLTQMFGKDSVAGSRPNLYFDYVNGRVMKSDLSGDEFDTWGYDRDNGEGAAEKALKKAGLIS